jgi:hypothetical protein
MTRRDKNIRKSCDEINKKLQVIADIIYGNKNIKEVDKLSVTLFVGDCNAITHRIKRTTWRSKGSSGSWATDVYYSVKPKYIKNTDGETIGIDKHPPATDY